MCRWVGSGVPEMTAERVSIDMYMRISKEAQLGDHLFYKEYECEGEMVKALDFIGRLNDNVEISSIHAVPVCSDPKKQNEEEKIYYNFKAFAADYHGTPYDQNPGFYIINASFMGKYLQIKFIDYDLWVSMTAEEEKWNLNDFYIRPVPGYSEYRRYLRDKFSISITEKYFVTKYGTLFKSSGCRYYDLDEKGNWKSNSHWWCGYVQDPAYDYYEISEKEANEKIAAFKKRLNLEQGHSETDGEEIKPAGKERLDKVSPLFQECCDLNLFKRPYEKKMLRTGSSEDGYYVTEQGTIILKIYYSLLKLDVRENKKCWVPLTTRNGISDDDIKKMTYIPFEIAKRLKLDEVRYDVDEKNAIIVENYFDRYRARCIQLLVNSNHKWRLSGEKYLRTFYYRSMMGKFDTLLEDVYDNDGIVMIAMLQHEVVAWAAGMLEPSEDGNGDKKKRGIIKRVVSREDVRKLQVCEELIEEMGIRFFKNQCDTVLLPDGEERKVCDMKFGNPLYRYMLRKEAGIFVGIKW